MRRVIDGEADSGRRDAEPRLSRGGRINKRCGRDRFRWGIDAILGVLESGEWNVRYVVATHTRTHEHLDHASTIHELSGRLGAKTVAHESSPVSTEIRVIHEELIDWSGRSDIKGAAYPRPHEGQHLPVGQGRPLHRRYTLHWLPGKDRLEGWFFRRIVCWSA